VALVTAAVGSAVDDAQAPTSGGVVLLVFGLVPAVVAVVAVAVVGDVTLVECWNPQPPPSIEATTTEKVVKSLFILQTCNDTHECVCARMQIDVFGCESGERVGATAENWPVAPSNVSNAPGQSNSVQRDFENNYVGSGSGELGAQRYRMTNSVEVLAQRLIRTSERQCIPGNGRAVELGRLDSFVIDLEGAPDCSRRIHDDDRRAAGIRIHVDEIIQLDVEAAFLARLAARGGGQRFAAIDVTAGEYPHAVSGFNRPSDQHDAIGPGPDNRADRDLRIQIVDVAAVRADRAMWLAGFHFAPLGRSAAAQAEPVTVRLVVWIQWGHGLPV
jgi:hypothetical protein